MSAIPEGWRQSGPTAIVRGSQSIAKTGKKGVDLQYELYGTGPEMIGRWPTLEEAIEAADRVRAGGDSVFECMACYPRLCHCRGEVAA